MDRRVGKTRRSLQMALIELMLEHEYEAITVQNIIDKANVGRSTFYAHFTDKQDLFRSGFADLREQIRQIAATAGPPRPLRFSLPLLHHCHEHRHLYQVFSGKRHSGAMMRDSFGRAIAELVGEELAAQPIAHQGIPFEALAAVIVGAYTAFLAWWLDSAPDMRPEDADRMFRELIRPVMAATPA